MALTRLPLAVSVLAAVASGAACSEDAPAENGERDAATDANTTGAGGAVGDSGNGGRNQGGSGAGSGGRGTEPPPGGCAILEVAKGESIDGFLSDVYRWRDARCLARTAAMVRNDAGDPAGKWGGFLRRYTYDAKGTTRTCDGSFEEHPGFGYVVSHWGDTATVGYDTRGTYETLFEGRHHAIHRYVWEAMSIENQNVKVTIDWMFATGRDHPLWAITYDMNGIPADAIAGDSRSPYGDMQWDGNGTSADVSGVGWGDRYKFESLGSPVSMQSGWDYTEPNTVPYCMEWADGPDAEMGLVQTQTYEQHDGGGYWSYSRWGMIDADGPMPEDWNWTYQLNQYELPFPGGQKSKRLAWGTNYGAVGQRQYPAYGDDRQLSGWPHQSYAVFVVFGTHSDNAVLDTVSAIEAVQGVTLTALEGSVATEGPAGAGRTDTAPYEPPGWDPVRATWVVRAASNRAKFRVETATAALTSPVFRVEGWSSGSAPASVLRDGQALTADIDYFVSVDADAGAAWITVGGKVTGPVELTVE